MHVYWDEVAPLAPLLVPATEWALFWVAIGIIALVGAFVGALLGGLSSITSNIPFVGGVSSSAIKRAEQAVTHALGTAEKAIDRRIGAAEHQMARIVDWLGRELDAQAHLLHTMASLLLGTATTALFGSAIRNFERRARAIEATAERALHRVEVVARGVERGIGADVLPRIRTLDRELEHVVGRDLPALRHRVGELERGSANLWEWIRRHPLSIASGAFAGAVAIALARLGMTWARCENWKRLGRFGCRLPTGLLDDLLLASIVAFAATDICDFANVAETVALEFEPALVALVDVENALVGCHGATAPPALGLPALTLPPSSLGLALAG